MDIEELKEQLEAVSNKNKQLLDELKKERNKSREIDIDVYRKALDDNDTLKEELSKFHNDSKLSKKELDRLQASLSEKDKSIHKLLVSDGITKELALLGIEDIETLMPYFERNATVDNGVALLNGKPIKESMTEWANGAGKRYIPAPQSSGGGGQGGGGSNPPKKDISGLSPIEMMKQGRKG